MMQQETTLKYRIETYSIVKKNNINEMKEEVNRYLRGGWIPQGGISVLREPKGYSYLQAMIKTVWEEKPTGYVRLNDGTRIKVDQEW